MTTENNTTPAAGATDDAREQLLNRISDNLERIRATPETHIDWLQEAMDLLEQVEAWTVEYNRAGYLEFRDPADDIVREAI